MPTAGKEVVLDSGKGGVLSSGKGAVYDTSGDCDDCCVSDDPCGDCTGTQDAATITTTASGDCDDVAYEDLPYVGFTNDPADPFCYWEWNESDVHIEGDLLQFRLIFCKAAETWWAHVVYYEDPPFNPEIVYADAAVGCALGWTGEEVTEDVDGCVGGKVHSAGGITLTGVDRTGVGGPDCSGETATVTF